MNWNRNLASLSILILWLLPHFGFRFTRTVAKYRENIWPEIMILLESGQRSCGHEVAAAPHVRIAHSDYFEIKKRRVLVSVLCPGSACQLHSTYL